MKLCFCLSTHPKYHPGGAERQMHLIGKELLKKGVDVSFTTERHKKNQPKEETVEGIKLYSYLPSRWLDIRKIGTGISYLHYVKTLNKIDAGIYHQRCAGSLTWLTAFFAKKLKNKKFVFTAAHIDDCTMKWSDPEIAKGFEMKYYRQGVELADKVVVLADYMKKAFEKTFDREAQVIKSGYPIPKKIGKKDEPPLVLWISRLKNWKRPEIFLKLAEKLKDTEARFLLIGPGSEGYKRKIRKKAKTIENLDYIPGVPVGEDLDYYRRASIFVNTSLTEGYPNTFIQSWMYETPVVSLSIDPDSDIEKNKLGFHSKTEKKLSSDVRYLLENEKERKKAGKRARAYAEKHHDIEKTAEKHRKLYKNLTD